MEWSVVWNIMKFSKTQMIEKIFYNLYGHNGKHLYNDKNSLNAKKKYQIKWGNDFKWYNGKPIYSEKKYLVPIADKFSLFL